MTVFDVGANIGQYTLLAARRVGPQGQVHAFEPTPHVIAQLRHNVALNQLGNVRINPVAVSDHSGKATLYYFEGTDAGENTIMDAAGGTACGTVPTVTLDDYVAERGLRRVDVIKMDIEGAELLALQGASDLLSGENAPLLLMEVHAKTLGFSGLNMEQLLGLLGKHGYSFYPLATYGQDTPDPWTNGLAAKPVHHERFPVFRAWQLKPMQH
jgi:FkbM family methyltransferase